MKFIDVTPVIDKLKSMQDNVPSNDFDDGFNNGVYNALDVVETQPIIDVEVRVHGKFVDVHEKAYHDESGQYIKCVSARCSVCRRCVDQLVFNQTDGLDYSRCAHCGAIINYE